MRLALIAGLLAGLVSGAAAATLDDPLHGMVCATGASSCNVDNGSFSPLTDVGTFGFAYSGTAGDNTGDLRLVVLAPAGDGFVAPMISGTNLSMPSALNFVGQWTQASGTDLATFLGYPSSSPANPFGGFQVGADTGVTAFNVFTIDIGALTLAKTDQPLADVFAANGGTIPSGVDIVAFLLGTPDGTVSTALSGQLQVTPFATTPLPGAFALFAPVLGFFYWLFRRRQRAGDLAPA